MNQPGNVWEYGVCCFFPSFELSSFRPWLSGKVLGARRTEVIRSVLTGHRALKTATGLMLVGRHGQNVFELLGLKNIGVFLNQE